MNRRDFLTVAGAAAVAAATPSVHGFQAGGYKGYLGLEFEAIGDPAVEVPATLRKLKTLAAAHSA